jgi:hypothetical protein
MSNKIQDEFTLLLNKVQQQISELEIIIDLDQNPKVVEHVANIKKEIEQILITKDLIKLQNIWSSNFNNKIEQYEDDDFM